jgi:hypothetical protein
MAAQKTLQLVSGKITQVSAKDTSAGAGDAGKVVALDTSGRIDPSMMPVGIGADVKSILASENISAGKYVNIYDDAGTAKIRLADNSNGREVHGWLLTSVTSGANGMVYFEGANNALTGLVSGARQYLDVAGGVTDVPPTFAGGALISQFLGVAVSATEINTDIDDIVVLA